MEEQEQVSRFVVVPKVVRTPQGSLTVINDVVIGERTGSGRLRPWRPSHIELGEGIEVIDETQHLTPRRLFPEEPHHSGQNPDEPSYVENDGVDQIWENQILDEDLAQELAVDSGSEAGDEEDAFTEEQLRHVLEDPPEDEAEVVEEDIDYSFTWSSDYSTFNGRRETFAEDVGPTIGETSPFGIFRQMWDQHFLQMICDETNRYAWQTIAQASETGISAHSRLNDWVETSVSELYRLFAVMILMGMCIMGQIDEYWQTGILRLPGFREVMSKDRYLLLIRFLHFIDNDTLLERGDERKISKIRPVLTYLNEKFQTLYRPSRDVAIDESLLLWKGRLSWVQCIRTKAARFGIKTYEMCESLTGYVLNIVIYTGKGTVSLAPTTVRGFVSSTAKIVLNLFQNYLGKGFSLYMDNFYNSVELCRYLKSHKTDVVGTLNRRRQNTPELIKRLDERRMARGAVENIHCGDVSVTAWKDVKLVTTVSTFHGDGMVEGRRAGQPCTKPCAIGDYNRNMGGVDLKDQKLSMYLLERKRGTKWYLKMFRRLLNISIMNSYIIYCANIGQGRKMSHRAFRYALVAEILETYGVSSKPRTRVRQSALARLDKTLNHFPVTTRKDGERTSNKASKNKRGRCVRCLAKKKTTFTQVTCSQCKTYLCLDECWEVYHSKEELTG